MLETWVLVGVGVAMGVTTVWFGFGGGFVAVPVVTWTGTGLATGSVGVATATALVVMLVNAGVATAATPHRVLSHLAGRRRLLVLLGVGGCAGALMSAYLPDVVLQWGFVAYVLVTVVDLLRRPGFTRGGGGASAAGLRRPLPDVLGVPIGGLAALLGVGGSVMTVPAMRRAGSTMAEAAALANPLTVAITLPATLVVLTGLAPAPTGAAGLVGTVDLHAAASLLAGAVPTVVVLRRLPVPVPDRAHAWTYLALLVVSAAAVATH